MNNKFPLTAPTPEPGISTPRSAVSLRAVATGFLLVVLVSILVPYSDNIRHNTYLVGNHLPIIVLAAITFMCLIINPLLGRHRLATREMALAIGMMMISCSLPSSGFFRYFQPQLGSTVYLSVNNEMYPKYIQSLPDFLLPSKDPNSWIIRSYFLGLDPNGEHRLGDTWGPWLWPYLAWAVFVVPMFLGVMFLCAIMRKQWIINERLPFPLAMIPLELMAEPEPGRRLNSLWRDKLLWAGAAIPLAIYLMNGMHVFFSSVPQFQLKYDITAALSEYPWNTLPGSIKTATLFFSVVGITYFVSLDVAFSLWFFYVAYQFMIMIFDRFGTKLTSEHVQYQGFGIWLVYLALTLWISRGHLAYVGKTLFQKRDREEFFSYRLSVTGILVCGTLAAGFLTYCGLKLWMAILLVLLVYAWLTILARIIMESGLLLVQFVDTADPSHLMGYLFSTVSQTAAAKAVAVKQWMLVNMASRMIYTDQRENLAPFAANAMRLNNAAPSRDRPKVYLLLMLAFVGTLVLSGATHHVLTYDNGRQNFDNGYGPRMYPEQTIQYSVAMAEPEIQPHKVDRATNVTFGAAAMGLVGLSRMLWTASPFHPIGLLLLNSWAIQRIWFSIFIAWILKLIVLRWGGAPVFNRLRPFFIGLLLGEALASVFWVAIGFLVHWPVDQPFQIMPN